MPDFDGDLAMQEPARSDTPALVIDTRHLAALERAAAMLDVQAQDLAAKGEGLAGTVADDARAIREVAEGLKRQAEATELLQNTRETLWGELSLSPDIRMRESAERLDRVLGRPVDAAEGVTFQSRVRPWMHETFGPTVASDTLERSDRFLEEALELVQAAGYTRQRAVALVAYVFGRAPGELHQEIGGVMVTLAALSLAHKDDMHAAGEDELARVWTKVDAIRAKQAAKPVGSALPMVVAEEVSDAA